jgi:hypothetical protein
MSKVYSDPTAALDGLLHGNMTIAAGSRASMSTRSLGCEAELVTHGFHAALHDSATACDFVVKLRELRSVVRGFQLKEVTSDQ